MKYDEMNGSSTVGVSQTTDLWLLLYFRYISQFKKKIKIQDWEVNGPQTKGEFAINSD